MQNKNTKQHYKTHDEDIRKILRGSLANELKSYKGTYRVVEELGVNHGAARVDIAVINGHMHGYEIKSDLDTLLRLPGQIKAYSAVFDKMTIVVGYSHLFQAINLIPDWWGIEVAKVRQDGSLVLNHIREAQLNQAQDPISLVRLLWREEALRILTEMDQAKGFHSKPRNDIYAKLASSMELALLGDRVREALCVRSSWRSA
jgi:hypothetical protein